jgi:hypothetical protein
LARLGASGWRVAVLAAAVLCAGGGALAQDQPPSDASALTIVARGPAAEFRIRGVSLKSARADDAQNTIAFDFNGPVSDEAFARLQDELPDWIEIAYAGYDNAIIRAKRPVTFMAKAESDGFSLRMVPRDGGPGAAPVDLRGADDAGAPPPVQRDARDWRLVETYFARAAAERPFDAMIRAGYDAARDGGSNVVTIAADWRHTHGENLYASTGHAEIETWSGVRLLADVHNVVVNAKSVRQPSLGFAPTYNYDDLSGALGVGIPLDGAVATVEALYGRSGLGARVGVSGMFEDWRVGMRAAYREPYTETAQAVSLRGERDYSAIFAAGQVFDGLWLSAEGDATRYGVHGDSDVARTAGFHAGLRYDIGGWPVSLTYDADGEYVTGAHKYVGAAPSPFVPLSIVTREVHQFGGAYSDRWSDMLWVDAYGGYAIDRYSTRGAYCGLGLRFTPGPGFDIALNGRYATVAEREGEAGNVLSAGLTLTYAWGDDGAPIARGGPGIL